MLAVSTRFLRAPLPFVLKGEKALWNRSFRDRGASGVMPSPNRPIIFD
jgi:hypothetical protein